MAEQSGLVLSESRKTRLFSFFLLYFGQGLPLGVSTVALPAWLVANGAEEAAVAALVGVSFLPWSFKFIPAALMDRYSYLPMGRRRAWLIAAQLLMVAAFAIAGFIGPGPDDLQTILYVVFLIGAGSAIQDVAVDGLAVDILPEAEQGTASSFMFGGQAVGTAFGGAAAGFALQYYGSQAAFLLFLPIVLLITLYVIVLRERPGEKRFPWGSGAASPVNLERHVGAWWPIFRVTLASLVKRDSLKLLTASALSRSTGGMTTSLWPIIGGVGFVGMSTAEYSSMYSTVGLVTAVLAIGIGSLLTNRLGPRRSTVIVCFLAIAIILFVLYGRSLWLAVPVFIVLTGVQRLYEVLSSICTNPMRMQLSDPQVAATQFTIYNSLSNLPVSLGATLFAVMGGTGQLPLVIWTAIALLLAAAAIYAWLQVGSKPVLAQPAPQVD